MLAPYIRPLLLSASILSALSLSSCSGIPRAKANTPRVEVEVSVSIDDSFAAQLEGVDKKFHQQVADRVVAKGDVGLRFYPVLTTQYSGRQKRPTYLMTVALSDYDTVIDKQVKESKDGDTVTKVVTRWAAGARCTATVTLLKRRANAPNLLVDRGNATVRLNVPKATDGNMPDTMLVKKGEGEAVRIPRQRVLDAAESAVRDSLRPMVTAIDRELALQAKAVATPK